MRKLNILAPVRYPWRFNGPRQSSHAISIRYFAPLNKISPSMEGMTVFNPFPIRHFDLIHAFNRIPLGSTPYIIGFESHLPRAFGLEDSKYFEMLSRLLASDRCRGIIAISEFARRTFLSQHESRPWLDVLRSKLTVRYPNLPLSPEPDNTVLRGDKPVKLIFVGNHFARKGGTIAVRIAEIAHKTGAPLEVDIISTLETGGVSWVDPLRNGYFKDDLNLLHSLPNIRSHGPMPNKDVLALIKQSHFLLLPTFSDTFGYSVIEAMTLHTPAIVTRQGALPEFVEDGVNGIVLSFPTDATGEWEHGGKNDRHLPSYESLFRNETERLAEEAYLKIVQTINDPLHYAAMRMAARKTAENLFSDISANRYWDDNYCKAVA
jgi:glycosyltransferase involved in cell wall biosynthesis